MASTPDPWLFCLLADATSPVHAPSLKEKFAGLQLAADSAIGSSDAVEEKFLPYLETPIIWMVPVGKNKVSFIHSFGRNLAPGEYFSGLGGFAQSASVSTIRSCDLACGLIGSSLARRTAVMELPSMLQFLKVEAVGELTLLKGDSKRCIDDLKEGSVITFFRPGMLASATLEIRGLTDAHTILFRLIEAVKENFGTESEHVPDAWTSNFERLWVIGNDWTNVVKIYRPKPSNFLEQHHGEKLLKLQRFLHPNGWGPEDSRTTEQKAADEIKEAEWQHPKNLTSGCSCKSDKGRSSGSTMSFSSSFILSR
jgi:hypothetical protein